MRFPYLLAQLFLNFLLTLSTSASPTSASYNTSNAPFIYCLNSLEWLGPAWPSYQVNRAYKNILKRIDVLINRAPMQYFEFLPEGETPKSDLPLQYTPFKISLGMYAIRLSAVQGCLEKGASLDAFGT